ncbi:MAG: hypothetical protein R2883_01840 [Caldisericia bacterium]
MLSITQVIVFRDSIQSTRLPVVTLIANGKPLGTKSEPDETFSLNAIGQAVPPISDIDWDYTCDTSGALGHNDPRWDCTSEMPNIEFSLKVAKWYCCWNGRLHR